MHREIAGSAYAARPILGRRDFLKAAGLGGMSAVLTPSLAAGEPRVLRHASIGGGGMAWSDIQALASNPWVKLVAVAEVDLGRIGELRAAFPGARVYRDWRQLLEREAGEIDSVNVSVPDHMHGPIAYSAMRLGKHCYCQKPLAHDVFETRALTRIAREKGLVTQMGIQFHAFKSYRQSVALIRSGVIGRIREVHSWSSKLWGDRGPPPRLSDPVPEGFDWDLWLGVAPERPFVSGHYHPANWRRRLDFGTGALGDMACHILDPVFGALGISSPVSVRSEGEAPDDWNWPHDSEVRFVFPGTPFTAADQVEVFWYNGVSNAPAELRSQVGLPPQRTLEEVRSSVEQGSIFVGTEGLMYLPHPGVPRLFPAARFSGLPLPPAEQGHHWSEWAEACVTAGKPGANFDYSGPLSEAVLLGCIAIRFPRRTLRWNSAALRFEGSPEADQFIRRRYRDGWQVNGL